MFSSYRCHPFAAAAAAAEAAAGAVAEAGGGAGAAAATAAAVAGFSSFDPLHYGQGSAIASDQHRQWTDDGR